MAKTEQEKTGKDEGGSEERWSSAEEAWEDVSGKVNASLRPVFDAARDIGKQMEEGLMSLVPPEVSEHLLQAQKELILAGRRLGDKRLEELEKKAERAREIHERMKAGKEAASSSGGEKEKKSAPGGKT